MKDNKKESDKIISWLTEIGFEFENNFKELVLNFEENIITIEIKPIYDDPFTSPYPNYTPIKYYRFIGHVINNETSASTMSLKSLKNIKNFVYSCCPYIKREEILNSLNF